MTYLVYCKDRKSVVNNLEHIIKEYKSNGIECTCHRNFRDYIEIYFSNDDRWYGMYIPETLRGRAFDIIYTDDLKNYYSFLRPYQKDRND